MRVRSWALLVVLGMIALTLSASPPSPMIPETVSTIVPQTISYDSDALSWPDVVLTTDIGTVGSDQACTFEDAGSGSSTGKGHVTLIDTIWLDPSACTRRIATATYPVASIPDPVWEQMDPQSAELVTRVLLPMQRTLIPTGTKTWSGSLAVTVRDPLNLPITQTIASLTWTGTAIEVTSWEPAFSDSWAQWSGWSRYAGRFDVAGGNEQYAYATTSAYSRNDLFCPGRTNTTYSSHWLTYFQGEPGGGWQWRRSLSYSGGCSWMLHDTVTLVTP